MYFCIKQPCLTLAPATEEDISCINTYFIILERSCVQEGRLGGFHCMPKKLKSNWNKKAEAKKHVYCILTSVSCTSYEKVAVFTHTYV